MSSGTKPAFDRLNYIPTLKQGMPNLALPEDTMIPAHCFKSRSLILVTVLVCSLGLFTHANAQISPIHAFFVDLNSRSATVIDLGTLGISSYASGINDAGQVVGRASTAEGDWHAFITGPNGVGMKDLGQGEARGINNAGQVIGWSGTAAAFITGPDGVGMREVGTLGESWSGTYAFGINDAGQVAGSFDTAQGNSHAFITGPNGVGMRDLGILGGGSTPDNWSSASGINNAGQVVGVSTAAESLTLHAFITGPNGMGVTDLGTLGGVYSEAYGINDAGQVVGESATASGVLHAFITGPDGVGMGDLGSLGGSRSRAYGINDVGQVVGESVTAEGDEHAFISPDGKGMVDLNSLVDLPHEVILTQAVGINNNGQVIAMGMEVMGVIPEPETYALMLSGLVLVGAMIRRREVV